MPAFDQIIPNDLPAPLTQWFSAQGWTPHAHQIQMLQAAGNALLIAPTGGGKTLAGFLPTLAAACRDKIGAGLHTLYVSPLKALTHDIGRNLARPVADLGLSCRIEDRTGDTPATQRARQRVDPPHVLLTTPESLALMLSYPEAPKIFGALRRVVIDEIHALAESKRGDQLMLCLSRLRSLAPDMQVAGLSATVENPAALAQFMGGAEIVLADAGPQPDIAMLPTSAAPPWSGAGGAYAARDVMRAIADARLTLVFINTRAQAELFFQALWAVNDENLPIGLHHGSLSRDARRRVEAAMAEGSLRAVVATGSLDLGLDWGDVDLVIQIGAPKNIKRLVQRIGRANHRFDTPSRARIVPANRFEVLECIAALQAVEAGELDGDGRAPVGGWDVLCQHILLLACSAPLDADALYAEVTRAGPYAGLTRADFDACMDFVATGGYALRAYDRWQRLVLRDGLWHLRDPRAAKAIRMNIGTIVAPELLSVRRGPRGGAPLGEIEESFAAALSPGDTFLIGGQTVRYDRLRDMIVEVTPQPTREPKIAVFNGLKMATSTELSARVLDLIGDRAAWAALPDHIRDWLALQARVAQLPKPGTMTSETFQRGGRWYFALYSFAGRNANQTLGLLLTHRMERDALAPLGFVATDYACLIWGLEPVRDPAPLLDPEGLRAGLQDWLAENAMMKRNFRSVATVAGLIQRNLPGARKSGKQATFSSDILYDTLRKFDPDHLLLQITRAESMRGLADFGRIEEMLRTRGQLVHSMAPHVTPFAAPLMLEAGRIPIKGAGTARLLEDEAARMMAEAGLTLEGFAAKTQA
ncbi:ligase-associated DNA damage response DEXH box helicase [Roseinatronobacter bogoriensis]|uniref:DNA ligase-associated DEXH box helicase n=1 Tax=Roseinatronobacter bogoriensis subsp. barguzinensis TaxID=441209 RepID=A0A2K8KB52_9RHOB|nr:MULTISPECIES: ligase-associated DNA damage response DEXH box helicase [Rhodobaca]ATX66671.1 DNA ligase-associated DEXH box helicase [Rhodobaca barguzinensis]MBB4207853.1 ATP-dependent Lhr-like helicase [Rhodobaca bogoriensis DSM 18756]TDW39841.1 ATP-dependent Lhr-like helicase [Rhodobaca barguzinensis]TDY71005.1 ATP-dependent Lhr-like helicase [Rhodobaca bogoriensis DSM 18756]